LHRLDVLLQRRGRLTDVADRRDVLIDQSDEHPFVRGVDDALTRTEVVVDRAVVDPGRLTDLGDTNERLIAVIESFDHGVKNRLHDWGGTILFRQHSIKTRSFVLFNYAQQRLPLTLNTAK
jgi:N-formylglutamate amidohydrolase